MATFDSVVADARKLTAHQIAATAMAENEKIMRASPRPLAMERHVDGVPDAPESAVRDGGVIVYDYNRLDQVASAALDTLRQLSPFDSGDYVRSHVLMLNGTVIGSTDSTGASLKIASLTNWKHGDLITISNLMPYTRKIEMGLKGYRRHGHVYEKAASSLNRRFGNQARIIFTYAQAPRGGGTDGIMAWASRNAQNVLVLHRADLLNNPRLRKLGMTAKQKVRHLEWMTRQPTLVIEELS